MRDLHEIEAAVLDQAQPFARGLGERQHGIGVVAAKLAHAMAHQHQRVEQAGSLDLGKMYKLDDLEHGIGALSATGRAPTLASNRMGARHLAMSPETGIE